MEIIQDKNSRSGLIGTILVHLLLLLMFLSFGMTYQDPPEPNEGSMMINFGTSADGMGEEQPENPTETAESTPQETVENETTTASAAEEQMTTQTHTETVEVNASENTTQETETVVEEQTASQNLSEALNAFNNNNSSSNSNEGETNNPGDQGSLEGDPNSPNHTGGIGNGVTYSLAGRNMLSTPKIKDNSQEQGKVVVDIVVDKNGKVIKATPGGRGSTTTSPLLYKKALEAALKTKFNAKPDLVGEQKGQMTFVFILN